ncbi:hypothetical protein B0E42_22000 [Pseudomonas sp. A25(2017)]|uniref:nuclear transport factor 2 family protein n=1 Tax=Pseudomonas sp. A25(2017) TaxID=1945865 RepID=UPI0009C45E3D|nr:nuclear transport factor 2 family protein [Pseudomonas sp. A25(2017)]OOG82516.1 hypothetical protein B0E42_22000 [Pseudomonas sp. A25(2017)]
MSAAVPLTVEDRFAIKDLLVRFAWALDTADADALVGCFTPDGVMIEEVFEGDPGVWEGAAGLRRLVAYYAAIPSFAGRQHYAANTLVEGGDGQARAKSFALVTESLSEAPHNVRFCGYYDDELVFQGGQWLFARRVLRVWDGEVLKRFPGYESATSRRRPPAMSLVPDTGPKHPPRSGHKD